MTPPSQNACRIAVIGGGISGLAAAHRLMELDPTAQVSLFEASDRLGGILATTRRDGYLIENSADSFITNTPWAIDLCRRIGLADQLIPTNTTSRGAMVVARGKLQRVPEGFVLMSPNRMGPLLQSPILSMAGKLRLLCERLVPPRDNYGSDIDRDESIADFARRRLGREAFNRLVQPLVGGIYTGDPEKLSMAACLQRFLEMERKHGSLSAAGKASANATPTVDANAQASQLTSEPSPLVGEGRVRGKNDQSIQQDHDGIITPGDSGARYSMFVTPRDGMESLVDAIAAKLPAACVRLNTPVERIERAANGWRVHLPLPMGEGRGEGRTMSDSSTPPEHDLSPEFSTEMHAVGSSPPHPNPLPGGEGTYDSIILATPSNISAKLLAGIDSTLAGELATIEHASSAIVVLGYDRKQIQDRLESFGFVVPAIERRKILSASYSSVKFPGRAPPEKVLIRVFIGGALQADLLNHSDDELHAIAEAELRELLDIRGGPEMAMVFRWPGAMPQYYVGHLDRLRRIEAHLAKLPGLALAGNAFSGVGIPQCIRSGEEAAERVLGGVAAGHAAKQESPGMAIPGL